MEVVKLAVVIGSFLFLMACAQNTEKSKDNVFANDNSSLNKPKCGEESIQNQYIVHWEDGRFTKVAGENEDQFKDGFVTDNLQKIKKIYRDKRVQFYTHDVIQNSEQFTPFANNSAGQTWGQAMIKADSVWQKNAKGKNVIVGVVDSYVDVSHSQIKNQILINSNEIPDNGKDDDNNGYVDDYSSMNFTHIPNPVIQNEHGTHVAGIIASDHSGLMKGIAPEAKIVAAPFISNDGSGSLGDAIEAMNYVVLRGAKVINASWGGSACVVALHDAFAEITKKGVLIVVAAGNDGNDIDIRPSYPAAFDIAGQITVGASNFNDYMTSFSNSSFKLVHLAAPGDDIMSTTPNEQYNYLRGTSMAAPFVAGAAAVLMGAFPQASSLKIKEALINSVDVVPNHEFRVYSRGRLNLLNAYNYLSK